MNKLATALSAILLANSANALRCNGQIVDEGDSISKVRQYCSISSEYRVENAIADELYVNIVQGGMTHTLYVVDGYVTDVQENR